MQILNQWLIFGIFAIYCFLLIEAGNNLHGNACKLVTGKKHSAFRSKRNISSEKMQKETINVKANSVFHIWMKANAEGKMANLSIGAELICTAEWELWSFEKLQIKETGPIELSWSLEDTKIHYIYFYEPAKVKNEGIQIVYVHPDLMPPNFLQSFHFRPPLGFINDPCGLSRTNDKLYHLFYQHNPHNKFWKNIHWGHAVSEDLIHWRHMPIFLVPELEKCKGDHDCGLYSGSAISWGEHGLRVFATENSNKREDKNHPQIQVLYTSKDTVQPDSGPREILTKLPKIPEELGMRLKIDFRDPNVFLGPKGYFYMLLGSRDYSGFVRNAFFEDAEEPKNKPKLNSEEGEDLKKGKVSKGGVILLYRSKAKNDPDSGWDFKNVLLTDNLDGMTVCECSGLISLGDPTRADTLWVLIYARMASKDAKKRKNLSTINLGTFDGEKFTKINEQTVDFVTGSFGYQGIYEPISKEAILFGWMANWPEWEHWPEWDKVEPMSSSLTLPRIIKLAKDRKSVLIGPHPNVMELIGKEELAKMEELLNGNDVKLPNGTAYIKLEINWENLEDGFFLKLGHQKYEELGIGIGKKGMEVIRKNGTKELDGEFIEEGARPEILHIFIDRDSLEVFGELREDGGMPRWPGATRLIGHDESIVKFVRLESKDNLKEIISNAQINPMKAVNLKALPIMKANLEAEKRPPKSSKTKDHDEPPLKNDLHENWMRKLLQDVQQN